MSQDDEELRFKLEHEIKQIGISRVAKLLYVSRNTIYNWIKSLNIPINKLNALRKHGVDVDYIMKGDMLNKDSINIDIGKRLKEQRLLIGLNMEQMAKQLNICRQTQSRYEDGISSPDAKYFNLASRLGVDVGYIITGNITPNNIKYEDKNMEIGELEFTNHRTHLVR